MLERLYLKANRSVESNVVFPILLNELSITVLISSVMALSKVVLRYLRKTFLSMLLVTNLSFVPFIS